MRPVSGTDGPQAGDVTTGRDNRRGRPRGYASWSPRPETAAEIENVNGILREYSPHLPLTVRQIFYRLVGAYDYEKTVQAYKRLGEHLVRARRAGLIPFEAIRDDGVVSYSPDCYGGTEDFWDATGRSIRAYRRDRQEGQRHRIELWCESAGMAPQLARVANRYSVPVFSAGGFSSLTAVRLVADRALDQEVPTVLLHAGDLDPSGESIFDALVKDASAFVERDRVILPLRLDGHRIALTQEQVDRFDLPTAPPKASDSRSRRWSGETCQLEALAPDVLAEIVDHEIRARINSDVLWRQVTAEEADRAALFEGLPPGSAGEDPDA